MCSHWKFQKVKVYFKCQDVQSTQICLVLSFDHISRLSVCLKVRILWSVPWLWASVLNKHWQSMTCLCVTLYCSSIQHWLNLCLSCVCSSHALPPDLIRRQTSILYYHTYYFCSIHIQCTLCKCLVCMKYPDNTTFAKMWTHCTHCFILQCNAFNSTF